jgi:hypothetical protein
VVRRITARDFHVADNGAVRRYCQES